MAEKKITWTTDTVVEIEVLDGPAKGTYQIDIEDADRPDMITIGYKGTTAIKVRRSDIPEYDERYARTPAALRRQRDDLVIRINAALDKTEAEREKGFGQDIGRIPSYESPEYRRANEALRQFDIERPEILAAVEQERQARVERHMWD